MMVSGCARGPTAIARHYERKGEFAETVVCTSESKPRVGVGGSCEVCEIVVTALWLLRRKDKPNGISVDAHVDRV